jgi:hypothetical protein
LARLAIEDEDLRTAESLIRQAITTQEDLVRAYPQRLDWKASLADGYRQAAQLLRRRNILAEARRVLSEATALQESVVASAPGQLAYRLQLRELYTALADLLVTLQEPSEAARLAEKLAALLPDNGQVTCQAAGILASCIPLITGVKGNEASPVEGKKLNEYCEDRALQLLREAIVAGQIDAEELVGDPQFAALADDPDFAALLDDAQPEGR